MSGKQLTIDDAVNQAEVAQYVKSLNLTEINIIRFLDEGHYQAHIAKRLKLSKGFVSKTVKELLRLNLISPDAKSNIKTYALTTLLRSLLVQNRNPPSTYTLCTPHSIRFKYKILHMQKGEVQRDGWKHGKARSIFIKSWKPRGPERLQFHVNNDVNGVGVEIHGDTLVAYQLEHKHIMADSSIEADTIAATAVQKGVEIFLREQKAMGNSMDISQPVRISKTHLAFESELVRDAMKASGTKQMKIGEHFIADTSPAEHGRPNNADIETTNPQIANMVDRGLRVAMSLDTTLPHMVNDAVNVAVPGAMADAMPTMMREFNSSLQPLRESVSTVNENVNAVMAHLMSGTTMQHQFQQMVGLMANTLTEMQQLREELNALKSQRGS